MFKIFKNRVCSFSVTLFILFFIQTVEGNASFEKTQFPEEMASTVSIAEKNAVIKAADKAVIIYSVEAQDGVALEKVEKVSAYSGVAFWRGIGIFSLLASLCVGDIVGSVISLLGIFCTL
ncbi:hypothetical protein [Bartonella massiliensis]|uniref:hypothetical protein n=1 Tax=Bartonella massiliensis TaxID=929795 RepID=UPI001158A7FB|nr:hypothetical protein [Bartonella massiliensis]